MTCGQTLKLVRMWKGLSQEQLGEKMKTSQQYISQLEKRKHFNGLLLKSLLKALNFTKAERDAFRKLPPPIKKINI